jgi:hypothetical protein
MQYSMAGDGGLFKAMGLSHLLNEVKYELCSMTDAPASGSLFTDCNHIPEAAAEQL